MLKPVKRKVALTGFLSALGRNKYVKYGEDMNKKLPAGIALILFSALLTAFGQLCWKIGIHDPLFILLGFCCMASVRWPWSSASNSGRFRSCTR